MAPVFLEFFRLPYKGNKNAFNSISTTCRGFRDRTGGKPSRISRNPGECYETGIKTLAALKIWELSKTTTGLKNKFKRAGNRNYKAVESLFPIEKNPNGPRKLFENVWNHFHIRKNLLKNFPKQKIKFIFTSSGKLSHAFKEPPRLEQQ